MKRLIPLLIFCFGIFTTEIESYAQEKPSGIIKGQLLDGDNMAPMQFANVSIFQASDSSLVTGAVTGANGRFEFSVDYGFYYLEARFVSYELERQVLPELSLSKNVIDLGQISLQEAAEILDAVEVRAEKSRMVMELDKKVFNVGSDLVNARGSATEILDNIPSVTVDLDGNVALRGSTNVRILIDGKPSGLAGISGSDALRSLSAALIESVEVITNPSSRYEASGNAGIINIILKKDSNQGFNGTIDLTAGTPTNLGASVNLNFRKEKINWFVNYGVRLRENLGGGSSRTTFLDSDDPLYITDQVSVQNRKGWSNNLRFGADYFLDKRNTLTGAFLYRYGKDENEGVVDYRDLDINGDLLAISDRTETEDETEPNLEYSVNYKRTFDKKGQQLTADIQYSDNDETEDADYVESFFNPDGSIGEIPTLDQRSSNKESQTNILFKIDYVQPFSEKGKVEAGIFTNLRTINNNYLIEELDENGIYQNLVNLSNDFAYDEDVYSAYAIVGNKINRYSYQLGMRMEHSNVLTELKQTNELNDRSYTNLFPSAFFSYDLLKDRSVQVSYSRRIRRPRFRDLNPFFSFSNSRSIRSGNPNLDPTFTDSYEISYLVNWEKSSLSSSAYYRRSTGVIQRLTTLDSLNRTVSMPENLSSSDNYGFEFTFNTEINKWWELNGNFNFFRQIIDGGNLGESLASDNYSWTSRLNSRMKIKDEVESQLVFNYRAPTDSPQGRRKAYYYLDMAFSKDIFNDKATLVFNARNLLNSQKYRYETILDTFTVEGTYARRNQRQFVLNLNYRINQKKRRSRGGQREEGGGDMEF